MSSVSDSLSTRHGAYSDVDTVIAGISIPEHRLANIKILENCLPMDGKVVSYLHRRHELLGYDWSAMG